MTSRPRIWHNREMIRDVFFVSDRTSITAETLGHSVLAQFDEVHFRTHTIRFVDSREKAMAAAETIRRGTAESGRRPIVFGTLVDRAIRKIVSDSGCVFFDLLDTFIEPLEVEVRHASAHSIGHGRRLPDAATYTLRMNAVNYALATDDGMSPARYGSADVIVVGVSRAGKTPACLFLAMTFGIYAANCPLTEENLALPHLPASLDPHRRKLFGLAIDSHRLHQVRQERRPGGRYSTAAQCEDETRRAAAFFLREGIPVVNATSMSVEEIAAVILDRMRLERRLG